MMKTFKDYVAERGNIANEMAARRSFAHSMGRWQQQAVNKPIAILTAFRQDLRDAGGRRITDRLTRLVQNRARNRELVNNLIDNDLGFYPVIGLGQEDQRLLGLFPYRIAANEESFVVQPKGDMSEDDFLDIIQQLVNDFGQTGATVKVPSSNQAFVLRGDGSRDDPPLGSTSASIIIAPLSGCSRPMIKASRVDFPEPEGPMRTVVWFCLIVTVKLSITTEPP